MESDSTVITTSPIHSNDSMPPTPNSVENSSANSPSNHYTNQQVNKQIKREVNVLTNSQSIMTSQSNRRRHYSSASSSADEDVDVVNETNKRNLCKHLTKKLNSNHSESGNSTGNESTRIKSESPVHNQSHKSLNSSMNGSIDQVANSIKSNGTNNISTTSTTILHSPNSNSSSNSQFNMTNLASVKTDSAAALIANLDAEQASRKFKSFLIEDILSQQQKKQQQILLLQRQQLLLQQFNNSKLLQQSSVLSPSLSSSTVNNQSPNSVHNLVNNSDVLNDSTMAAMAANMAYNSLTNSIIRPWDLTNSLANSLTNGLIPNSAAATLSQLTSAQNALNGPAASLPSGLASHSLALTLGTNVQTNTSSSQHQQHLSNHQANNHLQNGSSLAELNNQAAMAALAASQSPNNKLSVQQLQQLSRFGGLNYPHFASSLTHLNAHHQFLAGLNGSSAAGLFPNLANLTQNSALSAALKNDPAFRLHPLAHPFSNNNLPTAQTATDASLMQHLINSTANSAATNSPLTNGQQTNNKSTSSNVNSKQPKQSTNEKVKRLNVEDLDDEEYDNDTIMNDEDCDDKCSINSSTNSQVRINKSTNGASANGDNNSPLSALYELANNKNFEMTRTEKNTTDSNPDRLIYSSNGQNAKKKRKSRTAFTNKQIFELEKKFLYQKYLTPADRDDLAGKLDLSGAQVITWFQNSTEYYSSDGEIFCECKKRKNCQAVFSAETRRTFCLFSNAFLFLSSKIGEQNRLKRDSEEMNKDMQTAKMIQAAQLSSHLYYNKALIENGLPNMYESMPSMELFKAAKMHLIPALAPKNT